MTSVSTAWVVSPGPEQALPLLATGRRNRQLHSASPGHSRSDLLALPVRPGELQATTILPGNMVEDFVQKEAVTGENTSTLFVGR